MRLMYRIITYVLIITLISVIQPTLGLQLDCGQDSDANWSPDGRHIVFVSERRGNADIWVMDKNGDNPINLTSSSDFFDSNPIWSPDGKVIVFLSKRDRYSNLWMMNSDGSSVESLDMDSSHQYGRAAWSPTKNQIAVPFMNDVKVDIGIIDVQTKVLSNVTQGDNYPFFKQVSWSPDGSRLIATTADNSFVSVIEADGSGFWTFGLEQLNIQALWSPVDETALILTTPQIGDDNFDILLVNLDSESMSNLTESNPLADVSPTWSPDGRFIGFISDRADSTGNRAIWKMTAAGKNPINLTKNFDGNIWQLSWSPDGRQITFSAFVEGVSNIGVVNSDGTQLSNLSKLHC